MNVRCVIHVILCVMSHTSLLVDLCASFEINDSQHSFWEVLSVSLALILSSTYLLILIFLGLVTQVFFLACSLVLMAFVQV